jgi:hypothetical protein
MAAPMAVLAAATGPAPIPAKPKPVELSFVRPGSIPRHRPSKELSPQLGQGLHLRSRPLDQTRPFLLLVGPP